MNVHIVFSVFVLCFVPTSVIAQVEADKPLYSITTYRDGAMLGTIRIELFPLIAPKAVQYFDSLVQIRFYDSTAFHRVIPGFVIQGGDPNSRNKPRSTWGSGDISQATVPAEFSKVPYQRGTLGAARSTDINSATSQFFISVVPTPNLTGLYTVYGRVVSGMNIADSIVNSPRDGTDNPLRKISMVIVREGVNEDIPTTPEILTPSNNATRIGTNLTLTCTPSTNALLYHLEIAEDSTFRTVVYRDSSITTTISAINLRLGLQKYFARIRANNGGHYSAYSAVRSFTTAIAKPIHITPDSASTNIALATQFRWSALRGATAYHLQVATSALFTQSSMIFNQSTITDTSVEVQGLIADKRHFWRVAAFDDDYKTLFTQTWNFTTAVASFVTEDVDSPHKALVVFPQPVNQQFLYVRFPLATTTNSFVLRVIDITGKTLLENLVLSDNAFSHQGEKIDISSLGNGLYVVELQNARSRLCAPFVVCR